MIMFCARSDRSVIGITEAEIRLQLAEEDNTALSNGQTTTHEVTPAAMVVELLDLEEAQCVNPAHRAIV